MPARAIKIGLWAFVGLVVIIITVMLLALTAPVQTAVARRVLTEINRNLTGSIRLQRVHVTLGGRLALDTLRVFNSSGVPIAGFDKLRVRVDPLAAWREHRIHISRLRIDGLFAEVVRDSAGTNVERAIAPRDMTRKKVDTTAAGPLRWVIELDKAVIQGARTVLRTPDSTLFAADQWTLDADGRFGDDSLDYHFFLSVPAQLSFATEGSLVLGDSNSVRAAVGHLSLHADTSLIRPLAPQALAAGIIDLTLDYMTRTDSVYLSTDIRGSALGKVRARLAAPYPLNGIAGRGEILLDTLTPGALWADTLAILLNGRVQFTKHATASLIDGWDAVVQLGATNYGAYGLASTDLSVQLKDSTASIKGALDTGHGRVTMDAVARGLDPKTMQLTATVKLDSLDLHRLARQVPDSLSPISGHFAIKAGSLNPDHIRAQAAVEFGPLALGAYALDSLVMRAEMDGPAFRLDTLYAKLDTALLGVWAAGSLDGSVRYSVVGRIRDFSAMKVALKGLLPDSLTQPGDTLLQGAAVLRLAGGFNLAHHQVSGISVAGALRLRHARFGSYSVERASLRIDSAYVDSQYVAGRFIVRNFRAAAMPFPLDSLDLDVTGTPVQATGNLHLWARGDTLALATALTFQRTAASFTVALDSLLARLYGVQLRLETPARITLDDQRLTLDGLAITSDIGTLRCNGFVQPVGEQDLSLELSGLNTGRLAALLKKPLPESNINVRLQLSGTDKDLSGELSLRATNVVMDGHSVADEAWLHGIIDARHATVDGRMIWKGDTTLLLSGEVPARLSLAEGFVLADSLPMSGRLQLLEQPLTKLDEYMSPGTMLDGFLSSDLHFGGTVAVPEWGGTLVLRDGRYRDRQSGIDYRKMQIRGELNGDTLRIPSFDLTSGKRGRLIGTGWAIMAFPLPQELHLDLNLKKFEALDSRNMAARMTGHIRVNGPFDRLKADGRLKLLAAEYRINPSAGKELEPINLERELGLAPEDTTGGFNPSQIYRWMSHAIYVELPGNVWIRGNGANLELYGELWVNKDRNYDPTINGEINVREDVSRVSLLGREFRVKSGVVRFEGPITDPAVDITAQREFEDGRRYEISITGTVNNMKTSVGGDSLAGILKGELQSAAGVQSTATSLATSQLSSLLGGLAGLNLFNFRPGAAGGVEGLTTGSLEVGTYVTDRLFVRVLQPVEAQTAGQQVSLEYSLLRWLKLRTTQQGLSGSAALELLFQFDWR